MPRNLDHRLEMVVPVEDARRQQRLDASFDTLLADNAQAWELRADGAWHRLRPEKDERPKPTHAALMRSVRRATAARVDAPRRRVFPGADRVVLTMGRCVQA